MPIPHSKQAVSVQIKASLFGFEAYLLRNCAKYLRCSELVLNRPRHLYDNCPRPTGCCATSLRDSEG